MDKTILKNFAIGSRKDLMDRIQRKIGFYYVDEAFNKEENGDLIVLSNDKHSIKLTKSQYKDREKLIRRKNELGIEQVIEEAAYTWFNRLVAIHYMEINDYLPLTRDNQSLGFRVLSSKDNTLDPDILKYSNLSNTALDISFNQNEYSKLNSTEDKFKYLLLLVCKKLGKVIPQVFDGVTDYIDLLIPDNLLTYGSVLDKLINIPEDNFKEVEVIGWLYQYYNQVEKDRVINAKKQYKKNEIAYATQLFTPDWIVKYMVENSLGRYYIEHNGNSDIINNWKYLIQENLNINNNRIDPKDITCIDPCSGSGHILVYMFEVLSQIYESYGYSKADIPELILKNNLYGLDIDDRAGQLSILSVILKAREYDKNIFNKDIIKDLNIMAIQESKGIDTSYFDQDLITTANIDYLIETFKDAKEIGSLLKVENRDYSYALEKLGSNILDLNLLEQIKPLIKQTNILSNEYTIVVTNPPYMNNSVMSPNLKAYVERNYKDVKGDLFSSFIIKNENLCAENGFLGFMTPFVWMFISSYEKLRNNIIEKCNISSLIQMEYSSFEEATVPICSFVLEKRKLEKSIFINLTNYSGGMKVQENKYLEAIRNKKDIYYKDINIFNKISSSPIIYWASNELIDIFEKYPMIGEKYDAKVGIQTGNNDKLLRLWFEVDKNKISKKWFNHNKGGEFRKWYGNREYIINYENDGYELKNYIINGRLASRPQNLEYNFRKSISWNLITSGTFSARYFDESFTFNVAAPCCFPDDDNLYYILGLFNTKVIQNITKMLNPTLNMKTGDISKIPLIIDSKYKEKINSIVKENISISKEDWDLFETSWDFKEHPFIKISRDLWDATAIGASMQKYYGKHLEVSCPLEICWLLHNGQCNEKFNQLKKNEEELNRIFINIYGLQDEITPEVDDNNITIRKADRLRDIKSFISYAVGCMFGRYSLDDDGIIYAGGVWDLSKYKSFLPDKDNIIPIADNNSIFFDDDIVGKFIKFVEVSFGKNTLRENLDFIAETLGKKGTESNEETIRRYFINDFYKDHLQIYQKRPIYWLVDSGKKNGFKCLIYMHRYNEQTISKIKVDYFLKVQEAYRNQLNDINDKMNSSNNLSTPDIKEFRNRANDLTEKLKEMKDYYEKLDHVANKMIKIDLDDGVIGCKMLDEHDRQIKNEDGIEMYTGNYYKFISILEKIK